MTQFITGYFTGMIVMALIAWWIHNTTRLVYRKEYRRLMGGIKKAWVDLDKPNMPTSFVTNDLRKLFYNEYLRLRK